MDSLRNSLDVHRDELQRAQVLSEAAPQLCALQGSAEVYQISLWGCVHCVRPSVKVEMCAAMWETSLQLQARAVAGVLLGGFSPVTCSHIPNVPLL